MRVHSGALVLALVLGGCDDDPAEVDAGMDAGMDAGTDAGTDAGSTGTDAGPQVDAGPYDSGIPQTAHTAAMDTQAELDDVTAAIVEVPPAELASSAFVNLDACVGGIDHIIGETGIQTLSFEGPHRALADLEFVSRLLGRLDVTIAELATSLDGSVMIVHDEAVQLRAALALYQAQLVALVRARFDEELTFSTPVTHEQRQLVLAVTPDAQAGFFAENAASAPSGQAVLTWSCTGGASPTMVQVIDDETGSTRGFSVSGATLTLDTARLYFPLRVLLTGMPWDPVAFDVESCEVSLTSFRAISGTPVTSSEPAILAAALGYMQAVDAFILEQVALGSLPILEPLAAQVSMLSDVFGPLLSAFPSVGLSIARDDLYRLFRLVGHARATLDHLTLNPELAAYPSILSSVRDVQLAASELIRTTNTL